MGAALATLFAIPAKTAAKIRIAAPKAKGI
jgi:hypothetical protein